MSIESFYKVKVFYTVQCTLYRENNIALWQEDDIIAILKCI